MEEALIAMERARRLHGTDVIEALRIEALVALFSGKFAPAVARLEDVSRLSSQPIGDTYLALAYYYSGSGARGRSLLESLASHSSATTSARAGVSLAGVLAAQGDAAGARAQLDRVLARPYRDHHVAYGLGAAYMRSWAMPPPPAAGFGLLPTRASLACHGSSAIRCWNRFAAIASTSSSSPTCAAGGTPHSPPIIVDG